MQTLLASQVASISELKKNPTKLINDAHGKPVAILNHNTAAAYLIPVAMFEMLMELVDDNDLQQLVAQRLTDNNSSVRVDIDEL
jgi:antitoxin StbD